MKYFFIKTVKIYDVTVLLALRYNTNSTVSSKLLSSRIMFTAGIRRCFKSLAADFEAHDVFFKFQEEDKDKKGLLKSRCLYVSLESV